MAEVDVEAVARLAEELRRRGLATPALMLVDIAGPLSFFGDQLLLAFGPLLPDPRWHKTAGRLLGALRHDDGRELLRRMLAE